MIKLQGMEFYAYHGHLPEERIIGRYFYVDVEVEAGIDKAIYTDNLKDTVNYQDIYNIVKREMAVPSHLLEYVAGRIVNSLKTELPTIRKVKVAIRKNNPPLGGKVECAEIQVIK
ncbi:MAG: dihydroneopterin aldolase [Bacteroidales bacterium]|nr:dihydroneopterin aldolase [Bacteroidales bacterium]MCL2133574.1 dihydroneopterin aldolase [Bacteroidales bacterium]